MKLFECLKIIPDPRKRRGIRHPFQSVLQFVLLGFTCRLVAIEHMVAFFTPIWGQVKDAPGFTRPKPPDPTKIRRTLNGLRPEQLQQAFEHWIHGLTSGQNFLASVDGKAMKNVKGSNGLAAILVNVFAHDLKLTLAEYPLKAKERDPTVFREGLRELFDRYPGLKILTGDAAFAGRELNEAIIALGKDYIVQVKDNQPKLKTLMEEWFTARMSKESPAAVEVKKKSAEERNDGNCGLKAILELPSFAL